MLARFIAVVVVVGVVTSADAQTWEAQTVFGPGLESCSQWTADRKAGKSELAETWALGYVAALARVNGPNLVKMEGISPMGIPSEIDAICRKFPSQDLREAADFFAYAHRLMPPPD
ncbi:MAG: hypothetical protein WBQ17_09845 [Rhizomicrobium sp.]